MLTMSAVGCGVVVGGSTGFEVCTDSGGAGVYDALGADVLGAGVGDVLGVDADAELGGRIGVTPTDGCGWLAGASA
jgi:hypothetical protein